MQQNAKQIADQKVREGEGILANDPARFAEYKAIQNICSVLEEKLTDVSLSLRNILARLDSMEKKSK
jgi:hypothetical protein